MKFVHCPCGETISGETDDAIVKAVNKHLDESHPEMSGKYTTEQILAMAHEH